MMPIQTKNMNAMNLNFNCRYLVTTFKVVPRGTEGAVSVEGTFAGVLASILLASVGYLMGEVSFCFPTFSVIDTTY